MTQKILNINLFDNHLLCVSNVGFHPLNKVGIRSYSERLHGLHDVDFVDEVHIGLVQQNVTHFNIWH